ncbi:hypothetical protein ACFPU0_11520 [Pseudomonas sp. GCM10022186]|uniref:hypothetical protein n=1 Tax=Pseudomonas sp. GCM10022186 TaxID=3252650 RepID=UPI0036104054
MSIIAFRPCLGVTVKDDQGKELTALSFEPTAETRRRLDDQHLVLRPRAAGFQLYAQYNPEAGNVRLAPVTRHTSLVFVIRLDEADFLERFHPDLDASASPNLYLANLDDDGAVRASGSLSRGNTVERADTARIVGRRLNARADLGATPKPVTLKVSDRFDPTRVVANPPVNAIAGASSASVAIDLSEDAASAYTLTPQPSGSPTVLFVSDELAGRGAFGALELVLAPFPGPDPAAGRQYTATFRRRS